MTAIKGDGSVEFRFFRPQATRVTVAGDFNDWQTTLPMQPAGEGWWTASLRLPPGDYRFRYVADGDWYTDFAAHGVEQSPLGWNSVVVVPRRRLGGASWRRIAANR